MNYNFFFLIAFFLTYPLLAQKPQPMLTLEIGGSANTYRGELNRWGEKWGGNLSIALRYTQLQKIHFGVTVKNGSLLAQKINFTSAIPDATPNRNANTHFTLLFGDTQYNLWQSENEFIRVFLTAGGGVFFFQPYDDRGRKLTDQTQTRQEG
ncbi:MAG: hypothetical protein NZ521_05695, partial [Flammeovirgaceae bacterium]|nr:hypothetical protein [Flammeovirgaceae bacterium]MDW8286959.1 hypothetical protein [Flammeovirgaceae bacterium]